MISDNLAKPLTKVATKSFSKMHNSNKITIQRILTIIGMLFFVVRRGLRPVVVKEVEKMMKGYVIIFLRDRNLLNILFDSAKETLFYTFNRMNGKDHTFKPCFILTLHTFCRALNFNPHIFCLATEGGMDEESQYKSIKYINYETLRRS